MAKHFFVVASVIVSLAIAFVLSFIMMIFISFLVAAVAVDEETCRKNVKLEFISVSAMEVCWFKWSGASRAKFSSPRNWK